MERYSILSTCAIIAGIVAGIMTIKGIIMEAPVTENLLWILCGLACVIVHELGETKEMIQDFIYYDDEEEEGYWH